MPYRSSPHRKSSHSLFDAHDSTRPAEYLVAHVDGGARGNPGPAGFGVVLSRSSGETMAELSEFIGLKTNNFAEYSGLVAALEYCEKHGHKALQVISDSELLVKQMNGEYKVRSPELKELYDRAQGLARHLEWFRIQHVLREKNQHADRLANAAMDRGMQRRNAVSSARVEPVREMNGIVQGGVIHLMSGELPEGTLVKVIVKPRSS